MNWSVIFSILIGLLGIDILVIVHEAGHFFVSKLFHVFVEKVQIGFGPSFASIADKYGTQYCLGVVPYGAFCRMDSYSIQKVHPLKKILIYLAGPTANIIFSICCYTIYLILIEINITKAINLSTMQCLNELKMFLFSIGDIITGQAKISETLSGFFRASINIGTITRVGFNNGFMIGVETALWLSASVSISLAFANLIPIPALDGGYILISIIETITGHTFSEKFQIITQCVGLFILFIVFPIARLLF